MAPILIFALLFVYYPFLKTLVNSLCAVNDKGEILRFVGLENFKYVFGRNDFKKALRNSIVITLINVPVTLVLTISLALLATKSVSSARYTRPCSLCPWPYPCRRPA